jgi:hypothetical protein
MNIGVRLHLDKYKSSKSSLICVYSLNRGALLVVAKGARARARGAKRLARRRAFMVLANIVDVQNTVVAAEKRRGKRS